MQRLGSQHGSFQQESQRLASQLLKANDKKFDSSSNIRGEEQHKMSIVAPSNDVRLPELVQYVNGHTALAGSKTQTNYYAPHSIQNTKQNKQAKRVLVSSNSNSHMAFANQAMHSVKTKKKSKADSTKFANRSDLNRYQLLSAGKMASKEKVISGTY